MTTLADAMKLVREADPEERAKIERYEAVKDVDFRQEMRGIPEPSFAAVDPRNAAAAAQRQRYHEEGQKAAQAMRERSAAARAAEIEALCAGQTKESQALIRASFHQGS
jgi:hypothetical protein